MKLTVVGSSPAWPNPDSAQSGYLVEGPGRLLMDCGPGVLARLRAPGGWPEIDAVALTHFHLDHFADLVTWVWGALFGPGRGMPKPELWVARGAGAQLDHLGMHFWQADMFRQAFDVREYDDGRPFAAAGFEVTPHRVLHYEVETYGFRVSANGALLGYSGDSAPCEPLVEVARDADLFLCEATLARPGSDGELRGHLSSEEATEASVRGAARRLLLTHRPHELPKPDGVDLARDGLVLDIPG